MISKQKANRIAHGIVYDCLPAEPPIGPGWDESEKETIREAIVKIYVALKKKSV